jgi:flagellar assembly factor FliW
MNGASMEEQEGPGSRVITHFADVEWRQEHVITFPTGLPGFETVREFVLLSSPSHAPVQCLQAMGEPSPSFLVVDPRRVIDGYRTRLNQSDLVRLGACDEASMIWLAMITLTDEGSYANLRAPVVINPVRMLGFQLVPSDSLYSLRHPLFAA